MKQAVVKLTFGGDALKIIIEDYMEKTFGKRVSIKKLVLAAGNKSIIADLYVTEAPRSERSVQVMQETMQNEDAAINADAAEVKDTPK